jgi:hypothetical protein
MNHERVIDQDLIGRYRRNELPPSETVAFEAHLIGCRECQSLLAVDARLERGMRAIEVQEPAAPAYARRWRASLPLAAAAVLLLALGSTTALWFVAGFQDSARPALAQGDLPVYHLALTRGAVQQVTVLKISSVTDWYALEADTPPVEGDCCRVVIEGAGGEEIWQGDSPLIRDNNTVRVLLNRSLMGSGGYRVVLYADGSRRLIEHQVQVELTR